MIPEPLRAWAEGGRFETVQGHRVFLRDEGEGPTLLLLHGFPTCSLDFEAALPLLAAHRRVVVHDHLGFGLSDKPPSCSYSLFDQASVALDLWAALGIERASLLAHDYGTSVATEILARREAEGIGVELDSLVLCNGSVHIDLAKLTWPQLVLRDRWLGPLLARLSSRRFFGHRLRKTLADPAALTDADIAKLWAAGTHLDGKLRLPQISQYLHERREHAERWIGALCRLDLPTLVLWGRGDPVAVPAIAEALHSEIPGARLQWLDGLGHYPMVEGPETWAEAVLAFLDQPSS